MRVISVGKIASQLIAVQAFSLYKSEPVGRPNRAAAVAVFATPKVSSVSVCTAELCCFQDEGAGGIEILAELQCRNLPYKVDVAPCLGACGMGAKVAIEFEDGSCALVSGLQDTLLELGIPMVYRERLHGRERLFDSPASLQTENLNIDDVQKIPDDAAITAEGASKERSSPHPGSKYQIDASQPSEASSSEVSADDTRLPTSTLPRTSSDVQLVDARDRMRAEAKAAKGEQKTSHWMDAASYLVNKAAEKFLSRK